MGDAQATRRRLLDAAAAEFAAYGIAGARVDRIAANARANKAQLYSYFGSKDGLFDAVLGDRLDMIVNTVALAGDDLPRYATSLYDAYLEHPELVRLATWARLERTPTGDLFPEVNDHNTRNLEAIAGAQRSGHVVTSLTPAEVHALVVAIAVAWSPASLTHAASKDEDGAEHERRKRVLSETVRRAFTVPQQGT